ncbi:MAG: polyphosphate--glucose phosphotransferase [Acidimicrobiia bacterium]
MGLIRLGIDIGGSGVKAAPVDVDSGALAAERIRIETPQPAVPDAVADVVAEAVAHFDWREPIGVTYPGVVKHGRVYTAANVDESWIGVDAAKLFAKVTNCETTVLNDADAAGFAELLFGSGKDRGGVIVVITLGTGIGCAVFNEGVLLPNTELGHIELNGRDAELTAAARIRDEQDLSWKKYAKRVSKYLQALDALLWPDLFIIGGGVSKDADKWLHMVECRCEIVAAAMHNDAGVIGAALASAGRHLSAVSPAR